jgi:lysozyme family protein
MKYLLTFLFILLFHNLLAFNYPDHFLQIMESVLLFEGGFSDVLDDPGGATNFGVTQATYDVYRQNKNLPIQSVKFITQEEVYDCYYTMYYLIGRCDRLPPAVAFVMFDACVNFGPYGATKLLQKSLGIIEIDGRFDTRITNLVDETNDKEMALKFIDTRVEKRYEIVAKNSKKKKFLQGWLNRDEKLRVIITDCY